MPASTQRREVSPNNPCPFLRALVAQGLLPGDTVGLGELARTIVAVAKAGEGSPDLPPAAIRAIGLIANGLGPLQATRNAFGGVRLDALRGGPLDKKGAGSGILDDKAHVVRAELDRLDDFAGDKLGADGTIERGLDAEDLTRMMDSNFDRAAGRRRRIDRRLMDGEWPILLQVMGKPGRAGRYLSVAEVRQLFAERRLPERMTRRLAAATVPSA